MGDESVVVRIDFLRDACDRLLSHIADRHGDAIAIDWDYYWDPPPDELYNPTLKPSGHLSRLPDDQEFLANMLAADDALLGFGLVWLGSLMRAVGHKAVG